MFNHRRINLGGMRGFYLGTSEYFLRTNGYVLQF